MTSGLKRFGIIELSTGTVSIDVSGTALPAGVTDEQRRDFYFYDEPVTLVSGTVIRPAPEPVSTDAPGPDTDAPTRASE